MAMPRQGVAYRDTWLSLLRTDLPHLHFIDKTRRASTVMRLTSEGGGDTPGNPPGADLLEHYEPDIVILQIGITDCAPRYFDKNSLGWKIFSNLVPERVRHRYIAWLKKHAARDPAKADVKPDQFRAAITEFFSRARQLGTRVMVILIAPVTGEFVQKSPLISPCIENYNDIFRQAAAGFSNVEVIDPFRSTDIEHIAVDEFHVNAQGHALVAAELRKRL